MAELRKIEVGFIGNQVITLKVAEKQLGELRKKLSGGGWLTVATDDGEVELDLGKITFVRVGGEGHKVGF